MLKEALREPGAFSKVIALSPAAWDDPAGGPLASSPAPRLDMPMAQAAGTGALARPRPGAPDVQRVPSSRRSRSVDEIGLSMGTIGTLWDGAAGHQTWYTRTSSKAMVPEPAGKPRERAGRRFYQGMNASTSAVVFDDDHTTGARNPMLACRLDDDAAGYSNVARQTRLDSCRLATARKRTDIVREPDPAGAPLEIAGPGREANFLTATESGKKHGKAKFHDCSLTEKRCTTEIEYRGRLKMAPPQRSQIWDIVYQREDKDDTVGLHRACRQNAAGLHGADRVNFGEILTPRRGKNELISNSPVGERLLHHDMGPQANSPYPYTLESARYGGVVPGLQRSASAPPEPGTRTPLFDPYTRRGIVGCPRPVKPPARIGAFA